MRGHSEQRRLRNEILEKVRVYYQTAFGEPEKFTPGLSRISYAARVFDERELVNLVDASLDFWLTYGRYALSFERQLGELLGVKHCLLVNSGSSANLLAFMALTSERLGGRKIRRGDEVITVAAGFPTTVAPFIQYGAVPVFVDVDVNTANVDVEQLERAVSRKSKAVILAHTLGNPFDLGKVRQFCRAHGLWLIEDNCDALGSRYHGQYTGTFGDIGTSSFYPPHHLTMGEGGAVYTQDDTLAQILLSLRDWGRDCTCPPGVDNSCGRRFEGHYGSLPDGYDHKYVYSHFGYNLKATDLQAAIGCAQLEKLPRFIEVRRHNWQLLREGLADLEDTLILPQATPGSEPSWFGFLVTLRAHPPGGRRTVVSVLEGKGIQTRMLFGGNLIRQPCFDGMRRDEDYRVVGSLTGTDCLMENSFWLGVYPGLKEQHIRFMVDSLRAALGRESRHRETGRIE